MAVPILNIPIQSELSKPFIKAGDTIQPILFEFEVADGIDITGATIKMQCYNFKTKVLDLSSDTSGITITGARTFEIDKILNNTLPEGDSLGDVEINFADGTRETYFNIVYTISKQYTI